MAKSGIFTCNNCANQFSASIGGTFTMEEYACINCDAVIFLKWFSSSAGLKCKKCDGNLETGLKRKCKKCGSRDTEITKVHMYRD